MKYFVIFNIAGESKKISEYDNLDCAISIVRDIPDAIAIIKGDLIWEED